MLRDAREKIKAVLLFKGVFNMDKVTIQIQIQDGVVIDVLNLPSGVNYEIIDLDTSHAEEL